METWLTSTGNHDAGNHRHKSAVCDPSLSFKGHQIGKQGGEKRRGGTDSLIERDREVAKRNVAADDGATEDDAESRNLEKLGARFDVLERNDLHEDNGDVAEESAGGHVTHCEENWESEAVIGEEEFVEEEDADVGGVPDYDEGGNEEGLFFGGGGRRLRGSHCGSDLRKWR